MSNDPRQTIASQLSAHLDAELSAHRLWLSLAEQRLKAAKTADHAALTATASREPPVLAEINRLRSARERLLKAAAAVCGLRGAVTLGALCAALPEALRTGLDQRGRELRALLERLKIVEDHCAMLLRSGLSLIRDLLDAIAGAERPARSPYDRRGGVLGVQPALRGGLVDLRG